MLTKLNELKKQELDLQVQLLQLQAQINKERSQLARTWILENLLKDENEITLTKKEQSSLYSELDPYLQPGEKLYQLLKITNIPSMYNYNNELVIKKPE